MIKMTVTAAAAVLSILGGAAFAGSHSAADKTIVEIAVGSPDHTTLVAAVQAADLAGTLSGEGPFTLFAPTNAAFEALPAGTVGALLEPGMKDQLTQILTCHAVGADVMSAALVDMIGDDNSAMIETLGGCMLEARLTDGTVEIVDENGSVAEVTAADLDASNGVVHVIDAVILPKS